MLSHTSIEKIRNHYYFSLKHSFVYVAIPKVASSTVRNALNMIEMNSSPALNAVQRQRVLNRDNANCVLDKQIITWWQTGPKFLNSALNLLEYKSYATIRHPESRFKSAYWDKFMCSFRCEANDLAYRKPVCNVLGISINEYKDVGINEFADALEILFEKDDVNPHFMRQSDFLQEFPRIQLFRLNRNFVEDFTRVFRQYYDEDQIRNYLARRENERTRTSDLSLSPRTKNLLYGLYEFDYELFSATSNIC